MMLHAISHRVEGEYDDSRPCHSDVEWSEVFERVWGWRRGESSSGSFGIVEEGKPM